MYYYTYGSVLSALSRPRDNKCPEARQVFAEIRSLFSKDQVVMGIVRENENICNNLDAKILGVSSTPTPAPTATP